MHKSRTMRRVSVKLPTGKVVTHFRLKKPKKLVCPKCGDILKGTINVRPSKLSKYGKSERIPSRSYSNLCSKCARLELVKKAMSSSLNGGSNV